MNLPGSTKSKITKDKNGKNVLHLEITDVVLIHCNIVKKDYQQDLRFLYRFVPNELFDQLLETPQKNSTETVTNEHDKEIPKKRYISPKERQKLLTSLNQ